MSDSSNTRPLMTWNIRRMILVTGGLGFIGSHTVRALLDLGQPCLVTQHRSTEVPDFLRGSVDTPAVFASVDVTNRSMVLALRDDHPIDGIVHFVGALSTDPFKDMRDATGALANVLEAANVWKVKRVSVASAIGVYGIPRDPHPINEDFIVPLAGNPHSIVAQKKAAEIYAEFMTSSLGIECVVLRIAGIYGPRYRGMRTFVSRLAHAVARSQPLDLTGVPSAPALKMAAIGVTSRTVRAGSRFYKPRPRYIIVSTTWARHSDPQSGIRGGRSG